MRLGVGIKKAIIELRSFIFRYLVKRKAACAGKIRVNYYSVVTRNTSLGKNVNFNGVVIIGCGKVKIGDNFHSGQDCLIISQNHNYESDRIPYSSDVICKDICIGDNVWFGARVTILPGTKIAEGVIIQAGSVVHGEIEPFAIIGGNPAKVFKHRNKKKYLELKKKKLFH